MAAALVTETEVQISNSIVILSIDFVVDLLASATYVPLVEHLFFGSPAQ